MFMVLIKYVKVIWLQLLEYLKTVQKNLPLTVVRPGTQSRRFTHISDTVRICYKAWKANKCRHYSISHKKAYSIIEGC